MRLSGKKAGFLGLSQPTIASKAELMGLAATALGLLAFLAKLHVLGAALASLVSHSLTSTYLFSQYSSRWFLKFKDLLMPVSLSTFFAEGYQIRRPTKL